MATIEERVKQAVHYATGVPESELKAETHIINDLGADSLDEVELVMALEDEFEIEIPDEHAMVNLTIQEMVDYLSGRKSEIDK